MHRCRIIKDDGTVPGLLSKTGAQYEGPTMQSRYDNRKLQIKSHGVHLSKRNDLENDGNGYIEVLRVLTLDYNCYENRSIFIQIPKY